MADAPKYHIKLVKGRLQWHYQIVASNGQIISSSQRYFSHSNAKRAARKVADEFGFTIW